MPIFKNYLSIIRRFKMAVALNILGLSVAFAAFMIIMMQLHYDFSFDKFHKDYDKIFRLELVRKTEPTAVICRPLAELFFDSSPHIVAGAITNSEEQTTQIYIENNGKRNYYEEKSMIVTPEFFDVFTFEFVEGLPDTYIAPQSVFIPLSMARKFFGNEPAVGKQIGHSSWGNQTVLAVFRDLPENSIIKNKMYFAMHENKDNWNYWNYHVYFRVNEASNVPQLFENFKRNLSVQSVFGEGYWEKWDITLRFTALPDIHFLTDVTYDETPKASRQTLMILFAIAIVIIAIAGINFTNFSTALAPMRMKSINTQRILGARLSSLRLSLVSEVVVISLISYFVSIFFVLFFNITPLASLVDGDLSLAVHPLIVFGTALIALLAGLFAGLYPAFYMTSYAPAMVINSSFGLSPKGKKLRNTLIGVQYIASFALIIGASFMYLQNHFMQNSPLGYDKDALITVNIGQIRNNRDVFTHQIKSYSGIEDVTFCWALLSSSDIYIKWGGGEYRGEEISFQSFPVHHSFLKVMGIKISEGRDFRQEDEGAQGGVFIFNETAHKQYNMEIGSTIGSGEIIGFMPDMIFASFRTAVAPMAFHVSGYQPNNAYIKVKKGANLHAAMKHVQTTLAGFETNYPIEARFYDEVLQRLYEKEIALNSLITLFSLLAIFISIVGVFGLVVFDSECRRKEIGIRKVLGASTIGIIIMFNKGYFKILVVCFVIAAPLAWYAVHRWLENFAYKTPMHWWVYLLAFVAVAIITAATVTFQNWRVASDNPLKAIKSE